LQFNALLTLVDPFTREHRQRIIDCAEKRHLPAMYESREFVDGGGLVSYGPSLPALQRRVADYISMIFKGLEAGGYSSRAAHQIRTHHQPKDRQSARSDYPADSSRTCRRVN
jgi:hypothetical protein